MGRGKGKGKKLPVIVAVQDDARSSEEEKIHLSKKRGRPQKPLKDDIEDEEEDQKSVEEEDGENGKVHIETKDEKIETLRENGRKRKRSNHIKQSPVKVTDHVGTDIVTNDSLKSVGFRHNGSRRKNKPRRAAEVGVQCN